MTDEEIYHLLAVAMSYDNRRAPGDANIMAWREAADRGRWSFRAAVEAIHAYYAESTDFLMPGHITDRIRKARQLPPAPKEIEAPAAPPAEPQTVATVVAEIATNLGWQKPIDGGDPALQVECPWCHALPTNPCGRWATHGPRKGQWIKLDNFHDSRIRLAKEAS